MIRIRCQRDSVRQLFDSLELIIKICLDQGLSEIVLGVKIPSTRDRTERPRKGMLRS
jgi:hypothetical protein